MADETKDCCGKYCCTHCLHCYPASMPTLWGLPVRIVPKGTIPPQFGDIMLMDIQRAIRSDDVIEGVRQIMDGKIQMVVTDDEGHQNLVKIILERAPQYDAVVPPEDKL